MDVSTFLLVSFNPWFRLATRSHLYSIRMVGCVKSLYFFLHVTLLKQNELTVWRNNWPKRIHENAQMSLDLSVSFFVWRRLTDPKV